MQDLAEATRISLTPPPDEAGRVSELIAPYARMLGRAPGRTGAPPSGEETGYQAGPPALPRSSFRMPTPLVRWA